MPIFGNCKLCLRDQELLESHFQSKKLYYSGKNTLEFVTPLGSEVRPGELVAPLLCRECEHRFSIYGEDEVLRQVKPKLVLKKLPRAELMKVALSAR